MQTALFYTYCSFSIRNFWSAVFAPSMTRLRRYSSVKTFPVAVLSLIMCCKVYLIQNLDFFTGEAALSEQVKNITKLHLSLQLQLKQAQLV